MLEWRAREKPNAGPPQEMPEMIWQMLFSRGVCSSEDCAKFLKPKLKDLRDPLSIIDMQKAVDRLVVAYEKRESICVYGDFDLDGTSGLALLKTAFEKMGFARVDYYQPKRLSEGYGVHEHAVREIVKENQLMVTVDVGITAVEAVQVANEIGLDVIVTDHHQAGEKLPSALAVVNPNREDCQSGLGHLCGAGVGFYLILALRRALKHIPEAEALDPKDLLDCFVIGTLTDLVPLIEENRVLCKHGLEQLQKTQRPGLRLLLAELGLAGRPLTGQDVAIRFAPKINALSRMEKSVRAVDLYLENDEAKAKELVKEVLRCNEERISLQSHAETMADKMYRQEANENVVWAYSDEFHRGVVGLVATKLSKGYHLPAFIGALGDDGEIVGSARLPENSPHNLLFALQACSEHLVKFGGHKMAAGFELKKENAEPFAKALSEYWQGPDIDEVPDPYMYYDASLQLSEVSPQFMRWYEGIGPFGTSFDTPMFLFKDAYVEAVKKLRGGHIKITLRQPGRSDKKEALWFSPPSDHDLLKPDQLLDRHVDVLGEPQWNYFAGRKSIQLLVRDIRPAGDVLGNSKANC